MFINELTLLKNYPMSPNPGKVSHTCGSKSLSQPLEQKAWVSYMLATENASTMEPKLAKNDIYIFMAVATSHRHSCINSRTRSHRDLGFPRVRTTLALSLCQALTPKSGQVHGCEIVLHSLDTSSVSVCLSSPLIHREANWEAFGYRGRKFPVH